mmetsp:Transcript_23781/g.50144  ORF Transcript_23781/g.50144 Transcript_23781/m.50144 type:complete len:329 (+) Transcript_23781:87-1073(+)
MKTSSLSAMAILTSRSISSPSCNNFLFRFRPYHFLLCSSSSRTIRSSSARFHSTIITAAMNNNENTKNHHQSTLLQTHLERLKSSPSQTLLLDGGTGEELFLRGVPDDRKIWSATAVVHSQYHSILRSVHESFIEVGSDAITTNSYGIVPGVGFRDGEEVARLMSLAGEIARKAATAVSDVKADEPGKNDNTKEEGNARALVFGSLGPLVESYRPDLIMNRRDGVKCYRYAIEGLYPHIDVFLAETMSCLEEVCQVVDALSEFYQEENDIMKCEESLATRHPLLVSFTLGADGKIRNGDAVVEVIPKLVEYSNQKGIECKFVDDNSSS